MEAQMQKRAQTLVQLRAQTLVDFAGQSLQGGSWNEQQWYDCFDQLVGTGLVDALGLLNHKPQLHSMLAVLPIEQWART
jgi:hypothetical protein